MALEVAREWLQGPLMGISGLIDIVSSFIFQFKGVQVRELPRESGSYITCITELSNGWAVGDEAGNIAVYDAQCEQLLKTYRHLSPVRTMAACGADNGFVFNQTIGIAYRHNEETHWFCSRDGHNVFKLVTFPNGVVVSCSKITTSVHVYIAWGEKKSMVFHFAHSMTGLHRAADIVRCGRLLASVHQTKISGPNTEVWLWDARRGHHMHTFPLMCSYICNAISLTDGKMLFIDTGFKLHVYSEEKNAYQASKVAHTLCATPDGGFLTTRLHDDNFYLNSNGFETMVPNQNQTTIPDCLMSHTVYLPSGHVVICHENRKLVVWK
jgi:hypothetical protein